MKYPLLESLKEIARYALFMALSAFISAILDRLVQLPDQTVVVIGLTVTFRALDKFLHEKNKRDVTHAAGASMGLVRF